jgi:hypothetical protein
MVWINHTAIITKHRCLTTVKSVVEVSTVVLQRGEGGKLYIACSLALWIVAQAVEANVKGCNLKRPYMK